MDPRKLESWQVYGPKYNNPPDHPAEWPEGDVYEEEEDEDY